jgi:hypothetical protein
MYKKMQKLIQNVYLKILINFYLTQKEIIFIKSNCPIFVLPIWHNENDEKYMCSYKAGFIIYKY